MRRMIEPGLRKKVTRVLIYSTMLGLLCERGKPHLFYKRNPFLVNMITNSPVKVAVTGAAGQIGYSLLFRLASGSMLGPDQPLELRLIEIPTVLTALEGVVITALSPVIGYDKCAKLAHYAHEHDLSLREANQALKFLSDEEFQKVVRPETMTKPDEA